MHFASSLIVTVALALVTACTSVEPEHDVHWIKSLEGRPLGSAISGLGQPDGEIQISNRRTYYWQAIYREEYAAPSREAEGLEIKSRLHECTIKISVAANNLISSLTIFGDPRACASFDASVS